MRLLPLLAGLTALTAYTPLAQAQQADTLRIGVRDDPDILDPTFSRTYVGTVVMTAICDKLFDFNAQLNIVPGLATGYEWADSRTLLIRLRSGVKFHNGEMFDADAVKYTLERHLSASGSGALNRSGYSNRRVDELLDRARATSDINQRRAAYEGVWRLVSHDLPIIYLWTPRNIAGVTRRVAGFTLLSDGLLRLQDVRPAR